MQGSRLLAVLTAAWLASLTASAQSYKFVDLPQSEAGSKGYGINATGQIVGAIAAEEGNHSALWFNETSTDLHDVVHNVLLHPYFGVPKHEAYAISNGGQVVGTHQVKYKCGEGDSSEDIIMTQAFILSPAVLSDLGTPYPGDALVNLGTFDNVCVAHDSACVAISNLNHAVGWADVHTQLGITHAFVVTPQNGRWYAGTPIKQGGFNTLMVDLGTLDTRSTVSSATGVNDSGVVVGYSYTTTNTLSGQSGYHAFRVVPQGGLWSVDVNLDSVNDLMQDLGTLGGLNSWARGINNAGVIVGESDTADRHTRAFRWVNGVMSDLGTLGGDNSSASRINDNGDIAGWAETASGARHAAIWINGQIYDLTSLLLATDTPGMTLTEARDLNEHGQVTGWGTGFNGTDVATRAFYVRIATAAEVAEADAFVAAQNAQVQGQTADSSGNTNTGGVGDVNGVPINGTPNTLGDGNGGDDDDVSGADPVAGMSAICGSGFVSMIPLTVLGIALLRRRG